MVTSVSTLAKQISACKICVENPIKEPLPHTPNPVVILSKTAKIAICGQAPGNKVNISGKPFTDPSGDRLRKWLNVSEQQFYDSNNFSIVPMGFCFPGNDKKGGDLPPRKECMLAWHEKIFEAMPQLQLLLLIGGYAQKYHLGKALKPTLTQTVEQWRHFYEMPTNGPRNIVLPHPSWRNTGWIKKNIWFERDLIPFLQAEILKNLD